MLGLIEWAGSENSGGESGSSCNAGAERLQEGYFRKSIGNYLYQRQYR
jgi:hypothetical protein